jgi:hypothetical protein
MGLRIYVMPPRTISTTCLKISLINSTNTTAAQVVEVIPSVLLKFLKRSSRNLVLCVIPSEVLATACIINPFHQYYQHWSLQNYTVLFISLRMKLKFSFCLSYQIFKLQRKESRRIVIPRSSCLHCGNHEIEFMTQFNMPNSSVVVAVRTPHKHKTIPAF